MSTDGTTATEVTDEQIDAGLPRPCGYKILIALPKVEETYAGGILKSDATRKLEEVSTVLGAVLELGPDAYKDATKFPAGPWCKEGDFVIIRAYSGTRFKLYGTEYRLINDDTVEGVVADPRGYSRA
jgi:co-chaperonin GroES (HSP10)